MKGLSDERRRLVERAVDHLEAAQLSLFLARDLPSGDADDPSPSPQPTALF